MNAVDQAKTPEMATKIASMVSLFREEFLEAEPDFSPWLMDRACQTAVDLNSVDVSFHFPGVHPTCRGHCVLAMIRYDQCPYEAQAKVVEIEAICFCEQRQQWRISSQGDWNFEGAIIPDPSAQERIFNFFRGIYLLFHDPSYGPYQFR